MDPLSLHTDVSPQPASLFGWRGLLVLAAALLALPFPGAVLWGGDGVALIENALLANDAHRLATVGLWGTRGFIYGPLPTWYYQFLLLLSHDLIILTFLHSLILVSTTAAALCWLARLLRIDLLMVAAALAAPHLNNSFRVFWDNTLCIPIAAALLASYIHFARSSSRWSFVAVIVMLLVLPTIHLMTLSLCLPVAVAMLWRWRQWWRFWLILCLVFAAWLGAFLPYLREAIATARPAAPFQLHLAAWLFPLYGIHSLTAWGFLTQFPPQWVADTFGVTEPLPGVAGSAVIVASWIGLVIAAWTAFGRKTDACGFGRGFLWLLLSVVAIQWLTTALTGAAGGSQYFNATYVVHWLLLWLAARSLVSAAAQRTLLVCYVLLNICVTAATLLFLHHTAGCRGRYGPTLSQQMAVARQLVDAGCRRIDLTRSSYRADPSQAIPVLAVLLQRPGQPAPLPQKVAIINYADPNSPAGRLQIHFEDQQP